MVKWFLMQNEQVVGPFSEEEIRNQVTLGSIPATSMIWGRPQSQWQTLSWWLKEASNLTTAHQSEVVEQRWHYAINGDSKGPFTRVELINEIKALQNKGEILIWTKGMKAWADLFEFHDLLEEAGINRREHPRAPISGSVVLKYEEKTLVGVLRTISSGGFGASQLNSQLPIGQIVTVEIKSGELSEPMAAKAVVQYSSDNGFYGFKFSGINMEAKALILEYIRSHKGSLHRAA